MKKAAQLIALVCLCTSTVFATGKHKPVPSSAKQDRVQFTPLDANRGVNLSIKKFVMGFTTVRIFDGDSNLILIENLPSASELKKNYLFDEDGTYTVIVETKGQRVEKHLVFASSEVKTLAITN